MTKVDRRANANREVLRLCKKINKRAYDLQKLQPLVFELQEVLRQASYETEAVNMTTLAHEDNPFDRIMVDGHAE